MSTSFNLTPKIHLRIPWKLWTSLIDVMEKLTSHLVLLCISLFYAKWLLIIIHTCGSLSSWYVFATPVSKLSDGHFSTRITKLSTQVYPALLLSHEYFLTGMAQITYFKQQISMILKIPLRFSWLIYIIYTLSFIKWFRIFFLSRCEQRV